MSSKALMIKHIYLFVLFGLVPFFMTNQERKKPYGVTTITTSAGSKLIPVPSELALKYKLDIPIRRNGDFSLELKEYRQGVYVKDLLDDKIIDGKVNEGDRMEFVQFLDFKGGKEFQLFTYVGTSMWYKKKNTEKKFDYVQYEGNSNIGTSFTCPLFLIYEDDEKGVCKKQLSKLLKGGKLPDKYTPESEVLKKLPRFFIVCYRY